LTLALGIGANTAVFSVVNAVLLNSLPYPEPERLVFVTESIGEGEPKPVAYPNFLDWREQNTLFESLAAYSATDFSFMGTGRAERLLGEIVSDGYFSLLGAQAARGRLFLDEETTVQGRHPVIVLSDALWKRLGADPGMIGSAVRVNEVSFTVVGVMGEGFKGFSGEAEIWVPMMMRDQLWPQTAKFDFLHNRDVHWHRVVARLKPEASIESAGREMAGIAARLAGEYPKENANRGALVLPAHERMVGGLRSPLVVLMSAVAFVMLIACANVANLMLARAASRSKEIAIRMALGAGRARLVRQLLTESTLIALAGGVAGLLVAVWGVELLVSILPLDLPKFAPVRIDRGVLLFTLGVSLLTGLLLGLVPALQASRPDLNETLKEGGRTSAGGPRSRRVRSLLVVAEIALALVLMISAGLMIKSFQKMSGAEVGFNPDNILMTRFEVPNGKYRGEDRNRVGQQIVERVEQLPGVESVGMTYTNLFVWPGITRGFTVEGFPPPTKSEQDSVYIQDTGPNYFKTMGIPLIAGRDFRVGDDLKSQRVAVVTRSFAGRYWPDASALGKRLKYGPVDSTQPWMTIVGVVEDVKFLDLRQDPSRDAIVYVPLLQSEVVIGLTLVARTSIEPDAVAASVADAIKKFDPEIPVYAATTARERIAEQATETRSYALLMSVFAAVALILSVVGIYGVMSYTVAQRTHEIGIRMALGAKHGDVFRLVAKHGLLLALAGIAIGLAGSVAVTRVMASLLYGVSATDPVTFAAISLLLVGVALAACALPARRAMRVDPMIALRYE
jgi:putative ABC transport system permease protein